MIVIASLVSIVDDDESVRESLPDLLREFGYSAKGFSTGPEFLASKCVESTKCLILDVAMPVMTGPALKRELERRGYSIPTIFITAHAEAVTRPDVRDGAIACLVKPFSDIALLGAVRKALNDNGER